nr:MAG: site-2 protease family protein [Pseudomonadota bacterium]
MFRRGALTLFRARGVPIRLHVSVLILVPFLTLAIAVQASRIASLAGLEIRWSGWVFGLLASVGLLASIVLHELAHTLIAIRHGGSVESIVLMALGGVSQVSRMPQSPRHELEMAAAGPLTSLALAGLLGLAYRATIDTPDLSFALFLVAYLNLVLGLFNLLPAFPMDGGRVLRAALAWKLGRRRATQIATVVGKVMAGLFALVGLLGGGIWMILIAFFVWSGAAQEKLFSDVQTTLSDLTVGQVQHVSPTVQASATLEEARQALREGSSESAIVLDGERTVGVIRKRDILSFPPGVRARERVRDHMLGVQALTSTEDLGESFDRILREGELPVVDDEGHPSGVVRSGDVFRALRERGFRFPGEPPESSA